MAMQMRPRRPTFRSQPSLRPLYQDFKPKSDMTENPEAHVLQIQLPGFTKERIRVQYDSSSQLMVSGERPIEGSRRSRFREAYPVPQNCILGEIQSNFRQGILTIVMPKKTISPAVELKPTQEQALAGPPSQKADEQAIPPKSATAQEETRDYDKTAPPSTSASGPGDKKADGVPQKVTEGTEPKPTLKLDQGKGVDEKPQKVKQEMDEKSQKGQEETEIKPTSEMVARKPLDEKLKSGPEGTDQNAPLTSIPGEQSSEKTGERRVQYAEKERISDKEIIEDGKPSEPTKTRDCVKEKSMVMQKEIKERIDLVKADEHSVPKIPEKEKETTSKAEATTAAKQWNLNDGMIGTIGMGIKEVTTSASQAFTRIAEGKWDHEDKPLLLNMGASILVLTAVGVYALYRFSS